MSSTNRGAERRKLDAYYTPSWVVRHLCETWKPAKKSGGFVEPAIGRGAIVKGFIKWAGMSPLDWTGFDLRRVGAVGNTVIHQRDFLKLGDGWRDRTVAAVVSNTPWSFAAEFIYQSRRLYPNAEIVNLLRLGFLSSKERAPLYREIGAPDLLVLADRPSFTGSGADSADYAWFVWPPKPRKAGKVIILPHIDRKERIR